MVSAERVLAVNVRFLGGQPIFSKNTPYRPRAPGLDYGRCKASPLRALGEPSETKNTKGLAALAPSESPRRVIRTELALLALCILPKLLKIKTFRSLDSSW